MVGTMASIMSSTIVNVAIPGMSQHFALDQARAQWVTSGFMVAMTVAMLTTPWLLARYGYRHTLRGLHGVADGRRPGGRFATRFDLVLAARVAEGWLPAWCSRFRHHHPARVRARGARPRQRHLRHGRGAGTGHRPEHRRPAGGLVRLALHLFMVVPFCLASFWLAHRFVPVTAPGGIAARQDGAALDWQGWRWPAPARCACSTAWLNCVAPTPWRPVSCWRWRRRRCSPSSPRSDTCCAAGPPAGANR